MASTLIIGCGYLGRRVAQLLRAENQQIAVVTRTAESAAALSDEGYQALVADVTRPETLSILPSADALVYAVGYRPNDGPPIHDVYAMGLRNVLAQVDIARAVYISTTGVYGPAGGNWVDETTEPAPQRAGGQASLAAERELGSQPVQAGSVVLRLAGIYGPQRVPHLARIQQGEPLPVPPESHLNLIHVDDAAAATVAASRLPLHHGEDQESSRIYCVSDGHPVMRREFYGHLAELLQAPPPEFGHVASSSPVAQRAAGDKRVANARMKLELLPQLTYANYRQGLAAIVAP